MHIVERGSGAPVVMLHGFMADHRMLLPLDPVIDESGWRRVYLDLPGHGGSAGRGAASADEVVAAVTVQVREVLGDEPFAVLGYSFGGMIARRLAHDLRSQVRGLAVFTSVFVAEHDQRDVPERVVLASAPDVVRDLGPIGEEYAEMAVVQSPETAAAFEQHVWPGLQAADQTVIDQIAARYALERSPEESSEPFDQPSLIVTGRQDQVVGYRDAWAHLEHYPRATFATLDAAGHNVHLEQPGVTAALLTDWFSRMEMSAIPPTVRS